jgi:hypothetical protein
MPTCGQMWAGNKKKRNFGYLQQLRCCKYPKFRIFLLLAFFLAGCRPISLVTLPDPEVSQEHWETYIASAGPGQTIGQTFTTRRPQLNGLTLWVKTSAEGGELQVELYHTPADEWPVFTQTIPFSSISNGIFHIPIPTSVSASLQEGEKDAGNLDVSGRKATANIQISGFSPPSLPQNWGEKGGEGVRGGSQSFYLLLRPLSGTIQVRGRAEDIYPGGQAFSGQTPLQADFAFTTSYDYNLTALLADLRLSLPHVWLVFPLLVILFLPGWLLLNVSGLGRHFDGGERTGLAIGLSLAVIPLAMLWSTTLGLRWGRTGLLVAAGLLLAAALWRVSRLVTRPHTQSNTPANWEDEHRSLLSTATRSSSKLPAFSLLGIFLLSLGVRLVMARDLSAPAWVDSIHHATITRLILERGGFPSTYAPYIEIDAAEYHAGFHSTLAVFQWLSGLDTPEAMLLLGQVLNALIVFAVYLLAVTLSRQRTAGLAAAVVAGLFTPMPAYYTSWGRYTQLAGLLILPAGLALARLVIYNSRGNNSGKSGIMGSFAAHNTRFPELLPPSHPILWGEKGGGGDERGGIWRGIGLAAITCGGLALVHYRVAGFLALLLLCYFLSQVRFSRTSNTHLAKRVILFAGAAGLLALLLTLPWSWRAITQVFVPKAAFVSGSTAKAFDGFFWSYLTAAWGLPAMVLAGLGFLVSLFRRPSLAFSMVMWTGSLLLVGNLSALHLPGSWFVNTISVAITLFMPTAVLAGYALAQAYALLQALIPPRGKVIFKWACVAIGLIITLLAARALLPILRPSTDLFRAADRPAMDWISANIPADETILINPMYWGYGNYAGADGGFWITPLTGRRTIPPPVLYSLGNPSETRRISTLCDTVISSAADTTGLAKYLRDQELRYIYLGVRGGVLSPQALLESDQFELLYAKDGAWIFTVR